MIITEKNKELVKAFMRILLNIGVSGEAIIEVNKKPYTTLDVDNVFVFVKGTKDNFRITRTVRFNAEAETEMKLKQKRCKSAGGGCPRILRRGNNPRCRTVNTLPHKRSRALR